MKNLLSIAFPALALVMAVHAQTPTIPPFAAASVKVSHSDDPRRLGIDHLPGGRVKIENAPLSWIIADAYGLPVQGPRRLQGSDPILGERFDIDATPEPGAIPKGLTEDETTLRVQVMLRALLAERFHLKVRSEMKDLPVYAIVVGKDGSKLKPATIEAKDCGTDAAKGIDCHGFNGGRGRGLHAKAASMDDLASHVSNWTDRPLVDRTGLKGLWQFETRGWQDIRPGPAPAPGTVAEDGQDAASLPTVFTIFTDMGLKLEPQHAPVEMFILESVSRPVEN
jgi:uncharacterized protein (TIGR03435 family)